MILAVLLFASPAAAQEPACLDCHPDKQAAKVVHAAIAMGCGSCHSGTHAGEKPAPKLASPLPDLCFGCHDSSAFSKATVHGPVAGGLCASCHDPHGSDRPKLLTNDPPALCFTCHDQSMIAKKAIHPPAKDGQCTFCHQPHASEQAALLTQPPAALCASCHDRQASGRHIMARFGPNDTHPVSGRPDPSRSGNELSCASCHSPHGSDARRLFPAAAAGPGGPCSLCHRRISVAP